jgi:hypothetical protein
LDFLTKVFHLKVKFKNIANKHEQEFRRCVTRKPQFFNLTQLGIYFCRCGHPIFTPVCLPVPVSILKTIFTHSSLRPYVELVILSLGLCGLGIYHTQSFIRFNLTTQQSLFHIFVLFVVQQSLYTCTGEPGVSLAPLWHQNRLESDWHSIL